MQKGAKPPATGASPIRQKRGQSSKLHAAFVEYLRGTLVCEECSDFLLEEAITLRLANGVTYRPDVWRVHPSSDKLIELFAYEIKGPRAWDDAIVKLKFAPQAYPWITFFLVTRPERLGRWRIEEVLPC